MTIAATLNLADAARLAWGAIGLFLIAGLSLLVFLGVLRGMFKGRHKASADRSPGM